MLVQQEAAQLQQQFPMQQKPGGGQPLPQGTSQAEGETIDSVDMQGSADAVAMHSK